MISRSFGRNDFVVVVYLANACYIPPQARFNYTWVTRQKFGPARQSLLREANPALQISLVTGTTEWHTLLHSPEAEVPLQYMLSEHGSSTYFWR